MVIIPQKLYSTSVIVLTPYVTLHDCTYLSEYCSVTIFVHFLFLFHFLILSELPSHAELLQYKADESRERRKKRLRGNKCKIKLNREGGGSRKMILLWCIKRGGSSVILISVCLTRKRRLR